MTGWKHYIEDFLRCQDVFKKESFDKDYQLSFLIVRLVLPIVLTICFSIPTCYKLCKPKTTSAQSEANLVDSEKKTNLFIVVLTVAYFLLSYVPVLSNLQRSSARCFKYLVNCTNCAVLRTQSIHCSSLRLDVLQNQEKDRNNSESSQSSAGYEYLENRLQPQKLFLFSHNTAHSQNLRLSRNIFAPGFIVKLSVDDQQMILCIKKHKKGTAQRSKSKISSQAVFIDEIRDVFVGNACNTKKQKYEKQIGKIASKKYSCLPENVLTVVFGTMSLPWISLCLWLKMQCKLNSYSTNLTPYQLELEVNAQCTDLCTTGKRTWLCSGFSAVNVFTVDKLFDFTLDFLKDMQRKKLCYKVYLEMPNLMVILCLRVS
uniref:Uncharacterized protein n=1 Tax=Ditylenchus dipsaci TaxID=166011 RepID=A0A915DMY4_9BILA